LGLARLFAAVDTHAGWKESTGRAAVRGDPFERSRRKAERCS
jgi:hypothetical protein